jgi:cytochrome c2
MQQRIRCYLLAFALLGAAASAPAPAQDVTAGEKIVKYTCGTCHSLQPGRNLTGPSLFGVVGRHSGQVNGFHYSSANQGSGLVWDPPTLDRYLASPREVVPGTLMTFPGLKDAKQRADVIAYLATVH